MRKESRRPRDLSVPWELPADAGSVTLARHATRDQLAAMGVTDNDLIDTAELLVSELTSNVIKHTSGRPTLTVVRSGAAIRIEVADPQADLLPIQRASDADAEYGRGLRLVAALASAWGYERAANGKRTWVELDVDPEATAAALAGSA